MRPGPFPHHPESGRRLTGRAPAGNGHIQCLRWALDNGCPYDESCSLAAAGNGHLDVLVWIKQLGHPFHRTVCTLSTFGDRMSMLPWLLGPGGAFVDDTLCWHAVSCGRPRALRWALDRCSPEPGLLEDWCRGAIASWLYLRLNTPDAGRILGPTVSRREKMARYMQVVQCLWRHGAKADQTGYAVRFMVIQAFDRVAGVRGVMAASVEKVRNNAAAAVIQSAWRRAISDPRYARCRGRLRREFGELVLTAGS